MHCELYPRVFLVRFLKACLNFFDDSIFINAWHENYKAFKYSKTSGFSEYSADNWSFKDEGKLIFFPNTSWYGIKPVTLIKEFLVLTVHARVVSHGQLISSFTFNRSNSIVSFTYPITPWWFCRSSWYFYIKVFTEICKFFQNKPHLLSLNIFLGLPKMLF